MRRSLRLAVATFTAFPVAADAPSERDARGLMLWSPVLGLGLGLLAAAAAYVFRVIQPPGGTSELSAVAAIVTLAFATRGLHLDGLADTADGLGSMRGPEEALEVMRRGDIGPFGVTTLVLVLVTQVVALTGTTRAEHGTMAIVLAVVTGRLAGMLACTKATPPARPDGLGALVAGTVPRSAAALWTAVVMAGAAAYGYVDNGGGSHFAIRGALAVLLALGAAHLLRRKVVRRLGGITGDSLGAVIETATTVVLVVMALDVTCQADSGLRQLVGNGCHLW